MMIRLRPVLAAVLTALALTPIPVRGADPWCVPVADVNITPVAGSNPMEFTYLNGTTFFTADDGEHGRELWQTNGTDRTTLMAGDIQPGTVGSSPKNLTAGYFNLFFSADNGTSGTELWSAYPTMTRVVPTGDGSGNTIVQTLYDASLYQKINTLNNGGSFPSNFRVVNNILYFSADDGVRGQEPFRTGLPITAVSPAHGYWNINSNPGQGSNPSGFASIPGYNGVYFAATGSSGASEVWYNQGYLTAPSYPLEVAAGNPFNPGTFVPFHGALAFPASSAANGRELWYAAPGITMPIVQKFSEINPGAADASPTGLTDVNGTIFFAATDGTSGNELWKLSLEYIITKPGAAPPAKAAAWPWKPAGTMTSVSPVISRLMDINPGVGDSNPAEFAAVGGSVYFNADDGAHGKELWYSNGQITGTWMVSDINPGAAGSNPRHLTALGGNVYFAADDGVHGIELWRSDGTRIGTRLVRDICLGIKDSKPDYLTVVGNHIIFSAFHPDLGTEPWITGPYPPSTVQPGKWNLYQ